MANPKQTEHFPINGQPENHWEFGVNYGARRIRGFMCKIDFDHEIGHASDGNRIYPSIEALRREHTMADKCGIVEVEVTLYRILSYGDHEGEKSEANTKEKTHDHANRRAGEDR